MTENIKTYKDIDLHIFDYDGTLYLYEYQHPNQEIKYASYIQNKLIELKKMGKKIAIASHNGYAEYFLRKKYDRSLFDMFECNIMLHKDIMVSRILEKLNVDPSNAIFYDDLEFNINRVNKLGVNTYHVSKTGINFEDIKIVNEYSN